MAIFLASKFEAKTSDLVVASRKTKGMTNQNWSWDGSSAINVYTLTDPTIGNYDATAVANRYGAPTEVQDTIQTWTLSRDRSWTKTIDKRNFQDTMMVRKPGAYLAQATKNVLVPEIDTYILATLNAAATTYTRAAIVAAGPTSAANAYNNFLALNANITDNEAPTEGRVAAMTAAYYNFLKQGGFVLNSDLAYKDRKSGDLGEVDNVKVEIVPSARMPLNTDLVITHPSNLVAPEKLIDYTLHNNPPGIGGQLLEYRHRYDAFFDLNKKFQLAVHRTV